MTQPFDSNQPDDPTTSSAPESDKPKLVFAPGCFDNFEGTQEELQELIAEIHRMFESGEVFEKAQLLDDEEFEQVVEGRQRGPIN